MAVPPSSAPDPSGADPSELPEGTRLLDRYTIIDRAGTGGMASIYRALDDRLERVVCVKLLRVVVEGPGSPGGSVYQATYSHFLQEALALSKLQHPNTLRIYDFGYLEGGGTRRPFQISEYLDSGNLEVRVRRHGPLPHDEIERVLERMTGAVAEAHAHRIIHRDIKPSNILFARIGEDLVPKLADFGIARTELRKQRRPGELEQGNESLSSVALFSPRWAAPEQLCGAEEGPYTDVYALGLVTMFMLTARNPFDEHDVRTTFDVRVRSDDLLHGRMRDRGITGSLYEVLKDATRADPEERIQSPAEFFARIQPALREEESVTPSPTPPIRERAHSEGAATELAAVQIYNGEARKAAPSERTLQIGGYGVRIVDVNEALEFSRTSARASQRTGAPIELRYRVTMLPTHNGPLRINVKGLNCFVAWADGGGRPTPAVVASQDGAVDLISSTRETVGRISWSFATRSHQGNVFVVDGRELVIPYSQAAHAVAVYFGEDRELVVMCQLV